MQDQCIKCREGHHSRLILSLKLRPSLVMYPYYHIAAIKINEVFSEQQGCIFTLQDTVSNVRNADVYIIYEDSPFRSWCLLQQKIEK